MLFCKTAWNINKMRGNKKRYHSRTTALCLALAVGILAFISPVAAAPLYEISYDDISELKLIPGGMPFGVSLDAECITVVGVCDIISGGKPVSPAKDAGIEEKDTIIALNGQKVTNAAMVSELIDSAGGSPVEVTVKRGDSRLELTVHPAISDEDGKYRAGLFIREGTAGIGTVTYIDPETGSFAGLGHGICELDSGKLVPVTRGVVVNVAISGVVKGKVGSPGELQGYFSSGKIGTLFSNRDCGVYGVFCEYPEWFCPEAIPVAATNEICEGDAEILCTTGYDGIGRYKVTLSHIDHSGKKSKNFVVTVTDPTLLEKTGGIVQGMSGSPIIQNGKLVGAVTHVLVNDPTRGYGIFIENMLKTANQAAEEQTKKDAS